jgi:WD40 repeat protein
MSRQLATKKDAHRDAIWALTFVDETHLATGGIDGVVRLWHLSTKDQDVSLAGPDKTIEGNPSSSLPPPG